MAEEKKDDKAKGFLIALTAAVLFLGAVVFIDMLKEIKINKKLNK